MKRFEAACEEHARQGKRKRLDEDSAIAEPGQRGAWVFYDEEFRKLRAAQGCPWLTAVLPMGCPLGIPLKMLKTVLPATRVKDYGLIVDTVSMRVELPTDKVEKIRPELQHLATLAKTTVRALQSVVGRLNYACYVIYTERAFLRHLIDLLKGKKKHHHIYMNREARLDIQARLHFITHCNARVMIREDTRNFKVY